MMCGHLGKSNEEALEAVKSTINAIPAAEIEEQKNQLLKVINICQETRLKGRSIAHFDLDYFYVQAELLARPDLRNVPVAVGDLRMLSTTNYAARDRGVHSGMAGHLARHICPELILLQPNFNLYEKISLKFHDVVGKFGDSLMVTGFDECYVDLTRTLANMKNPVPFFFEASDGECHCYLPRVRNVFFSKDFMELKHSLHTSGKCEKCGKMRIRVELKYEYAPNIEGLSMLIRTHVLVATGITCSAGIAPTFPLAKLAADVNKPNNYFVVTESSMNEFVMGLKMSKFGGFGDVLCSRLAAFNIETVSDAYNKLGILKSLFSESQLEPLLAVLGGMDAPPVFETLDENGVVLCNPSGIPPELNLDASTVGAERTFTVTDDREKLLEYLDTVINEAMEAALKVGRAGSAMYLKLRFFDFKITTPSIATPALNLANKAQITTIAQKLFAKYFGRKIRLIGVRFAISYGKHAMIQTILDYKPIEKDKAEGPDSDVEVINVKKNENCFLKSKTPPKSASSKTPESNQIKKYLKLETTSEVDLHDDDIVVLKKLELTPIARSRSVKALSLVKTTPSTISKTSETKRRRVTNANKRTPAKKLIKDGDLTPFVQKVNTAVIHDDDSDIEII